MSRPTLPMWDRPQPRASSSSSAWQSQPQPWRGMGSGYPVDITSTFSTAFFTFSLPTSTSTFASAPDAPSASIHPPPPPKPPRPAYLPPSAPWPTPPLVPIPNHPLPPPPRPLPRAFHSTGIIHPPPPSASHSNPSPPKKKKRERAKRAPRCLASILPAHAPPPVEPLFTRKPLEFPTLTSPVKPRPPSNAVPPPAPTYSHRSLPATRLTATTSHSPNPAYFLPSAPPHPYPPTRHVPPDVSLDTATTFDYGILDTLPSWVTSMGSVTEDEGVLKEVDNVVDDIVDLSPPFPAQPLPLAVDPSSFPTPFDELFLGIPSAPSSRPRLSPIQPYLFPPIPLQQVTAVSPADHTPSPPMVTTPKVEGYVPEEQRPQPPKIILPGPDLGIVGCQMPTERPGMEAQEAASTDGGKGISKDDQVLFARSQFGQPSRALASQSVFAQHKRPAEGDEDDEADPAECFGPSGIDGVMELRGDADAVFKRFRCEVCGDLFGRRNDCVRHQRSAHSSEKPFICPGCSTAFARKDKLRRHQQSSLGKVCRSHAQPKRQRR